MLFFIFTIHCIFSLGTHRDAFGFGAADAASGSAVLVCYYA